jgi:hypothetical protein
MLAGKSTFCTKALMLHSSFVLWEALLSLRSLFSPFWWYNNSSLHGTFSVAPSAPKVTDAQSYHGPLLVVVVWVTAELCPILVNVLSEAVNSQAAVIVGHDLFPVLPKP